MSNTTTKSNKNRTQRSGKKSLRQCVMMRIGRKKQKHVIIGFFYTYNNNNTYRYVLYVNRFTRIFITNTNYIIIYVAPMVIFVTKKIFFSTSKR